RPDYLAGHSIGEISAAHAAGVLTLQDAAKLVAARATLMQQLPTGGTMIAVEATEDELQTELNDHVSIAAINSPRSIVLSGDKDTVTAIADRWKNQGRRTRRLDVSHAFHSPHMNPILDQFQAVAEELTYRPPTTPIASNLTGDLVQDFTPDYWARHIREAVRFHHGIRTLDQAGTTTYLEISPTPTLTPLIHQTLDNPTTITTHHPHLTTTLAHLHTHGITINWNTLFPGAAHTDLPTYPFQHQHYWLDARRVSGDVRGAGLRPGGHPLLGAVTTLANGGSTLFTGRLAATSQPWLTDCTVHGVVTVPAAALVELTLHAGDLAGFGRIERLVFEEPLTIAEGGAVDVQVTLTAAEDGGSAEVTVHGRRADEETGDWTQHATARLAPAAEPSGSDVDGPTGAWPPAGATPFDVEALYDRAAEAGVRVGPAFEALEAAWTAGDDLYARIEAPEELASDAARYGLHPALFDAALQPLEKEVAELSGLELYSTGATELLVRVSGFGRDTVTVSVTDATGEPVARVASLTVRHRTAAQPVRTGDPLLRLAWQPAPTRAARTVVRPTAWPVLGSLRLPEDIANVGHRSVAALLASVPEEEPVPSIVLMGADPADGDSAERADQLAELLLGVVQEWLAEDRLATARLVVLVDESDLAQSVWRGLIRTAQAEHPDRFTLVAHDGSPESWHALGAALDAGEPEVALHAGTVEVPRLVRVTATPTPRPLNPNGTVLITGGTGALG
ncbi:acyltransferase domain-containing protein, partial [Streptomyces sp. NPDC001714]|uniref:acyltransferase domain-containing protein n=1 Tax=Streptomyces sp. NPDC001714 TaxID=3364603 RepID=UPI0036BA1314